MGGKVRRNPNVILIGFGQGRVQVKEVNGYSGRKLQFEREDSEERRSVSVATIRVNIGA